MKKLKLKNTPPVPYLRIEGELMKKFNFINDQIFDFGEYMFVPEELYNEVINGHS